MKADIYSVNCGVGVISRYSPVLSFFTFSAGIRTNIIRQFSFDKFFQA
jgi:hypothetical protein